MASREGKGLDYYMGIVSQSNIEKTAAVAGNSNSVVNQELLSKIANELVGTPAGNMAGAPPQVDKAKDGADLALALAGLNAEAQAKGDEAKPVPVAAQPVVSSASPESEKNSLELGREPASVAAAAQDTEKVAELKRAEEVGAVMAKSFHDNLEKIAFDREYQEALDILNSRNLLANYNVVA